MPVKVFTLKSETASDFGVTGGQIRWTLESGAPGTDGAPGPSVITIGSTAVAGGSVGFLLSTDGTKVTQFDPAAFVRINASNTGNLTITGDLASNSVATQKLTVGGKSISGTNSGDQDLTGYAALAASNTFAPVQTMARGVQIGDNGSIRKGTHTYYDAGSEHHFGSTGFSGYFYTRIATSAVSIGGAYVSPLTIQQDNGFVLSGSVSGGVGKIQLGRRISDSNVACGAAVEGWPTTTQTEPVFAVMVPGGGSYRAEWRPNGSMRLARVTDAAAENDTWYFSTTQSKPAYKDSAGVVHTMTT